MTFAPRTQRAVVIRWFALLFLIFSLMLIFSRTSLGAEEAEEKEVSPAELQPRVKLAKPQAGELPIQLHAVGVVIARAQAPAVVAATIAGVIGNVLVLDGQTVTSGTIAVKLNDQYQREALAKAEAGLRAAKSDLRNAVEGGLAAKQADADLAAAQAEITAKVARREAERQASLFKEQLTSDKAATEARQTAESTERAAKAAAEKARYYRAAGRAMELARFQAAVEGAESDVRAAKLNLGVMVLRAPQSGRISDVTAMVGKTVDAGGVVARITSSGMLGVRVGLVPGEAGSVRIGAPVVVRSAVPHPTASLPPRHRWKARQPGARPRRPARCEPSAAASSRRPAWFPSRPI